MKTNFLQKSNNYSPRNKKKKALSISILALFLLLFFYSSFSKSILFAIGKPIWIVRNNIVSFISSNHDVLKSKLALINENNTLKEQIQSYEKDRVFADAIKKENEDLKNILNRNTTYSKKILSAVLEKPYLSPYDTLIIDVGSRDGVSTGDKVLANGYNFIGYVSEVYDGSSKVILYSSYGEKVKVFIGPNNVEKEAMGIGGGNFKIEMPKEMDIKEGDSITIPSISANLFAVVEKVESKENDSFENILFKSVVNMSELRWVEVILPLKPKS